MKISQIVRVSLAVVASLFIHGACAQPATNAATGFMGARMSIALTNNSVAAGSNLAVFAQIKNSSTNGIGINLTGDTRREVRIWLVDHSGKEHDLFPEEPVGIVMHNHFEIVSPGKTYECKVPVQLNATFKPGKYKLKATRVYLTQKNGKLDPASRAELVSNPLELEIK
jgi:hypothetical protein